jgi:hypothetical protein
VERVPTHLKVVSSLLHSTVAPIKSTCHPSKYALAAWAGTVPEHDGVASLIVRAGADRSFAGDLVDVWSRARRPADFLDIGAGRVMSSV